LAEARPLAFKPPFSDLPSFLCHAGDLAIEHRYKASIGNTCINTLRRQYTFAGD
jgi:hypothetical protein